MSELMSKPNVNISELKDTQDNQAFTILLTFNSRSSGRIRRDLIGMKCSYMIQGVPIKKIGSTIDTFISERHDLFTKHDLNIEIYPNIKIKQSL